MANAGVHGSPVELALQDLWIMEVTITTGMVSTSTTPMLLTLVATNRLPAAPLATHTFEANEIMEAHDTFGRAAVPRRSRS